MQITNINMKKIAQFIMDKDIFLVTSHLRPDGDAIGSGLALVYMLQSMGKYAIFLLDDKLPVKYSFIPFFNEIRRPKDMKEERYRNIFVLDSSNLLRVGKVQEIFTTKYEIINIDHHPDNDRFGAINWVEEESAATGELLFKLASYLKIKIDKNLATLLAVAIITDTGSFQYSNTSPFTHYTMARLLEEGADSTAIIQEVYGNYSLKEIHLYALVLGSMEKNKTGSLAWCTVDQDMIEESNYQLENSQELVNYPRSMAGVLAGILFIEEKPNSIRVNLRSSGSLAVNRVASLFGGGGHVNAAGCVIHSDLTTAKNLVIGALERELSLQNDGNHQSP